MGKHQTRAGRLAAFFRERPGVWVDGRELEKVGGRYAWRSRVSDARRLGGMTIRNRQRRVRRDDGSFYIVSEYMFEPAAVRRIEKQQERVTPSLPLL